jgi:transposase
MDAINTAALEAILNPQLAAEQAHLIYEQGAEAVVFALLTLARQLAKKSGAATAPDPSAPSGQTPPYTKPMRGK